MPREDYNRYFEILELSPGSSLSDVRSAYQQLRELYSTDSIAMRPVRDELSEENRKEILSRIEDAYSRLKEIFEEAKEQPAPALEESLQGFIDNIPSFGGQALGQVREKLGLTLRQVAVATRITRQYLEDIESEKFSALPPEVFIRGYLVIYARHLGLDPERVASDYMTRYSHWKKTQPHH